MTVPIIAPISPDEGQDALAATPSPHALREAMDEAATVGYVQRYVGTHQRWCPALKVLRRWSVIACVLLGVLISFNLLGAFMAKSLLREAVREGLRAELREQVDTEVRKALTEMGIVHAELEAITNGAR